MHSYYRKHNIKEFAKVEYPLTELVKMSKNKIIWPDQHEKNI